MPAFTETAKAALSGTMRPLRERRAYPVRSMRIAFKRSATAGAEERGVAMDQTQMAVAS